jgi:hypothetical protein
VKMQHKTTKTHEAVRKASFDLYHSVAKFLIYPLVYTIYRCYMDIYIVDMNVW